MLAETKRACRGMCTIKDNYFSKNILLQWIFWKRLQIILDMAKKVSNPRSALDFGMGWGVLLPSLSKIFKTVYGVDIHKPSIDIASQLIRLLDCRNVHVQLVKPHEEVLTFGNDRIDCIIAADVLEHIPNLSNVLSSFEDILADGGYLIISIPTENLMYRMAKRFLRHPTWKDKHLHNRVKIIREIKKRFVIKEQRNLMFFEIFRIEKVNGK